MAMFRSARTPVCCDNQRNAWTNNGVRLCEADIDAFWGSFWWRWPVSWPDDRGEALRCFGRAWHANCVADLERGGGWWDVVAADEPEGLQPRILANGLTGLQSRLQSVNSVHRHVGAKRPMRPVRQSANSFRHNEPPCCVLAGADITALFQCAR
jgi:hypothetical protein